MNTEKIFYTPAEVAKELKVTTQTVRNWIREFPQLKVRTDEKGRRQITRSNLEIMRKIKKEKDSGVQLKGIKKNFSKKVDKNIENIIIKVDSIISRIDRLTKKAGA